MKGKNIPSNNEIKGGHNNAPLLKSRPRDPKPMGVNLDYKQMWNELKVKLSEQYDMCLEKEILGVYNTMIEMENK